MRYFITCLNGAYRQTVQSKLRPYNIIHLVHIPPFVNHIFNVFINIYEYAN